MWGPRSHGSGGIKAVFIYYQGVIAVSSVAVAPSGTVAGGCRAQQQPSENRHVQPRKVVMQAG